MIEDQMAGKGPTLDTTRLEAGLRLAHACPAPSAGLETHLFEYMGSYVHAGQLVIGRYGWLSVGLG